MQHRRNESKVECSLCSQTVLLSTTDISSKLLIFFLNVFFFHVQSSKASHCASAASYSVVKLYFRKLLVSRFAYRYMQQLGVYFVSSVIKSWH